MVDVLEEGGGFIGFAEPEEAVGPVEANGLALEGGKVTALANAVPMIEGGSPVGIGDIVESLAVAELVSEVLGFKVASVAKGLEEFVVESCGGEDLLLEEGGPEGGKKLSEAEVVGGGVGFELDGV